MKPLMVGNWKMNRGPTDADALAASLRKLLVEETYADIAVAPPFLSIPAVVARLKHSNVFLMSFTESLMTYALGRGLEPVDMPVVRGIVRKSAANDYKFLSVIQGIVESAPFQMRTKPAPSADTKVASVN